MQQHDDHATVLEPDVVFDKPCARPGDEPSSARQGRPESGDEAVGGSIVGELGAAEGRGRGDQAQGFVTFTDATWRGEGGGGGGVG